MVAHTTCELDDQIVWITIERGQHDVDIVPVTVVNFQTMQTSGKISGCTTENQGMLMNYQYLYLLNNLMN